MGQQPRRDALGRVKSTRALGVLCSTLLAAGLASGLTSTVTAAPVPKVSGTLVDFEGAPLAGYLVHVDGAEVSTTDMEGGFSSGVTEPGQWAYLSVVEDAYDGRGRSSRSHARLGPLDLRSGADLEVGQVRFAPLDEPTSLRITDTEGDPVEGATWLRHEGCRTESRPDLSTDYNVTLRMCALAGAEHDQAGSDANGRLLFALAQGLETEVMSAAQVRLTDPATGDLYVENLSDAEHDEAGDTWSLTVPGIDAPPALEPPAAPTGVLAKTGRDGETMEVIWDKPTSVPGRAAPDFHTVRISGPWSNGYDGDLDVRVANDQPRKVRAPYPVAGATYDISVTAESAFGSPTTSLTHRHTTAPSKPGKPIGKMKGPGKVKVSWAAPRSDGGLAVRYVLMWDGKRIKVRGDKTRVVLRKQVKGPHQAVVMALNDTGRTAHRKHGFTRIRVRY